MVHELANEVKPPSAAPARAAIAVTYPTFIASNAGKRLAKMVLTARGLSNAIVEHYAIDDHSSGVAGMLLASQVVDYRRETLMNFGVRIVQRGID